MQSNHPGVTLRPGTRTQLTSRTAPRTAELHCDTAAAIPPHSLLALGLLWPAFLVSWSHLVPCTAPAPCSAEEKLCSHAGCSASDSNSWKTFFRILHKPFRSGVTLSNRFKIVYLWQTISSQLKIIINNYKAANQLDADFFFQFNPPQQ